MEAEVSSIESLMSLAHVTGGAMLSRLDILESANVRLRSELITIRTLLTSNVALRDKMQLLEQLTTVGIPQHQNQSELDPLL